MSVMSGSLECAPLQYLEVLIFFRDIQKRKLRHTILLEHTPDPQPSQKPFFGGIFGPFPS